MRPLLVLVPWALRYALRIVVGWLGCQLLSPDNGYAWL